MFKTHANTARMLYVINVNLRARFQSRKHDITKNINQSTAQRGSACRKCTPIHPALASAEGVFVCDTWLDLQYTYITMFPLQILQADVCVIWEEVECLSSTQTSIFRVPSGIHETRSLAGSSTSARTKGVLVTEASHSHSSQEFLRDPLAFCKALNSIPPLIHEIQTWDKTITAVYLTPSGSTPSASCSYPTLFTRFQTWRNRPQIRKRLAEITQGTGSKRVFMRGQ